MFTKHDSNDATNMAINISALLNKTEQLLSSTSIRSPRLDAEILLSHTLGVERSWLHAHGETELKIGVVANIQELVNRRLNREPIAYIIGKKEFYGRSFIVTPKVLIPRPETEDLIELSLECFEKGPDEKIVDVGSGSGCIGITLKLERPSIDMTITDISSQALAIAKKTLSS
jgi:release factor glutamine methyltransferase